MSSLNTHLSVICVAHGNERPGASAVTHQFLLTPSA
jgi:hypothetical protein